MKFQGNGKVYLAPRNAQGAPGAFFFVGCADALDVAFAVEKFTHTEKCSGTNAVDYEGIKSKTASMSLTLTEFNEKNLELALNGTAQGASAPGTVTSEELPDLLVDDDLVILGGATPHQAITGLVITDSDSPPNTLALNTNYTVDAATGFVTIVDLTSGGPFTQPLIAAYGYTDKPYVSMFTQPTREYWMRYDYINVANAGEKGLVDLYKVRLDPTSGLPLINEEILSLQLGGSVLIDNLKDDDGDLGQFGRISTPV